MLFVQNVFSQGSTDYRNLMLKQDFKCRADLRKFCFNIYKSLINADYDYFSKQLIVEKDINWMGKCFKGDSVKRISSFKNFIDKKNNNEKRIAFLSLSKDLGISFLDSISIVPRDYYPKCEIPLEIATFYFSIPYIFCYPNRTLTFNVVKSPIGYKIIDFTSDYYTLKEKETVVVDKLPIKMPQDFEFIINGYFHYAYDSKREIYYKPLTRNLTLLKVSLTQKEKRLIYDKIKIIDACELPKAKVFPKVLTTYPVIEVEKEEADPIRITINVNGLRKTIKYCSSIDTGNIYWEKLQELFNQIDNILLNKKKVKEAPPIWGVRI